MGRRLYLDFFVASLTLPWTRYWPQIFADRHWDKNCLRFMQTLVVSRLLVDWLSCEALWLVYALLMQKLWSSDWRLLQGCSLRFDSILSFRWGYVTLLAWDLNEFGDSYFQSLRGICFVVGYGKSWLFTEYVSSGWSGIIELLARFVPAVNSMLHRLYHLFIGTTILIPLWLGGLPRNWSKMVFLRFPGIFFLFSWIRFQDIAGEFRLRIGARHWLGCYLLSLRERWLLIRWLLDGTHLI